MLRISPRGSRAILQGVIDPKLEIELCNRFNWTNPEDLNDCIYFYSEGVMYCGVMSEIQDFLTKKGVECEIDFTPAARQNNWNLTVPYRPLQEDAVNAMYEARFGILRAPPGTGKTLMMSSLVARIGRCPAFIVAPNERPFTQAINALSKFTDIPEIGCIGDNTKRLSDVNVALMPSIHSELTRNPHGPIATAWRNAKVVLVDESHKGGASTYLNAFDQLEKVEYFMGFSATPTRTDERADWLDAILGRVVYNISRKDAIDNGLSVPLTVFVEDMPYQDYGYIRSSQEQGNRTLLTKRDKITKKTPYETVYEDYIINNPHRNRAALNFCKQAIGGGLSTCISVSRIEHINQLRALDPNIVELHGTTKNRDAVFADIQSLNTKLVASTLMDEATDVASLSCVVMLAGGKSSIKLEQRIRCDRIFEGMTVDGYFAKERGYVWFPRDHADFLTSHSDKNVKLLRSICDEHDLHEFYVNGTLVSRRNFIPRRAA